MESKRIALLPGDGIGPEVIREAKKVLEKVGDKFNCNFSYEEGDIGGIAIDKHGEALPEETIQTCKNSDAILLGAVGGKKWNSLPPGERPERAALLPLRKKFELYANLRPAIFFKSLNEECYDILVVRELTGGIYFGEKNREDSWASDQMKYHAKEVERIAKVAFEVAMKRKKKVTSVDKANVLESMLLWREKVKEVAEEYPQVRLEHMYVDNAAMQLVKNSHRFDVLLCPNMFGDILSDLLAGLVGSLGLLPSASLREDKFGLYEPVHGSAPDIAGKGVANPIAQILSVAMMLKYSFNLEEASLAIETAVEETLQNYRTPDIMEENKEEVSTSQMGDLIAEKLENEGN